MPMARSRGLPRQEVQGADRPLSPYGVGSLRARGGDGYQLLRLTLERKSFIIRQLVRNAGKISWKNTRAAGRHQPL